VKRAVSRIGWIVAFLVAAALTGCGYTTQPLHPQDVTSVNVPVWTLSKNVYRCGLEMRLTEALQKRISQDTRYKIADKGSADTQLTGTIEKISQRVLSGNPDTGRPRETEITITVSFKWTDLRSGKERVEVPTFRVAGTYIPHRPFGEDFFKGSEGVIDKLARRIVEQLESEW